MDQICIPSLLQHVTALMVSAAVTIVAPQSCQLRLSTMSIRACVSVSSRTQYGLTWRETRDKLCYLLWTFFFFNLSSVSGLSTPPTTPTQSSSQPVFTQEAQPSRLSPERLEPSSRSRSLSTPPDTGQRLSLPSAKPPIPSSSPVPPYSTSQQVSHTAEMLCYLFSSEQFSHSLWTRNECGYDSMSQIDLSVSSFTSQVQN